MPPGLATLSPLPASMVFSKFPAPPSSSSSSLLPLAPPPPPLPPPPSAVTPPAVVCMPPEAKAAVAAALDLSTKGLSTPSTTPPPLVINSDAEDEGTEEEEEEEEEIDPRTEEDQEMNGTADKEEEEEEEEEDEPSRAQLDFEKMIHEKLVSLSPSAAAILPSTPLPKARAKEALAAAVKGDAADEGPIVAVGGVYQCDQCDKTFTKKSSITRHKYEHSGEHSRKKNRA